ncbi:MAG: SEL1-like repeat protein [Alphaproteobacteria bacterium]|nr:SEL1-like repeat protein [Alphaproteobacteria bacterium]
MKIGGGMVGALALLVAVLGSVTVPMSTASAEPQRFSSAPDALRQGISAYRGGYHEIAIPALEYAASQNLFLGTYFLARLYADSNSSHTDHGKAYMLFRRIANEHADVDPDLDARARYVAKSLTSLAKYVRLGLPEIRLAANPSRAAEYLHHAAIFFNDEDAQFELSKMQLNGDGVRADVARGRHWLAILAQNGHPGAQAFLADLYWRGKFMPKDQVRALTLISVAVKNAGAGEDVWIEDIYQSIYCGASQGVREQATGMVAEWDSRYGRKVQLPGRSALGGLNSAALRTCADGRRLPLRSGQLQPVPAPQIDAKRSVGQLPSVAAGGKSITPPVGFMSGAAVGGSMVDVGARGR